MIQILSWNYFDVLHREGRCSCDRGGLTLHTRGPLLKRRHKNTHTILAAWTLLALTAVGTTWAGASIASSSSSDAVMALKGAGGTFPEVLYQDAMFSYNYVTTQVSVSYLPTGSGGGKCRIKTDSPMCDTKGEPYKIDFAGSDSLLSDSDYTAYPDLQMYPTVAGAVTAVYSHPAVKATGKPLVLKISTIASIFGGDITTWDDSDILADQEYDVVKTALQSTPGKPIEVVVRGEVSGTTQIWTKALTKGLEQSGVSSTHVVVSDTPSKAWPNPAVTYTQQPGNEELAAYVATTDYTFGYIVLGYALDTGASVVWVRSVSGKNIIEPSIDAVQFAVAELGLSFGNTGESADRLTADVEGAQGTFAWPAAGYTYLVMRKDTDVFDDCARRRETVNYWHWFYTSDVAKAIAVLHGFSPLPESVSTKVVSRLLSDIKCADGSLAQPDAGLQIPIYYSGPSNLEAIMALYSSSFISVNADLTVLYTAIATSRSSADWQALWASKKANEPLIAPVSQEGESWWSGTSDTVAAPFVQITTAVFVNTCESTTSCPSAAPTLTTVTLETLAKIISGNIAGADVWAAMGVTNAASPTVLCPPSNSAERAVATKALTGAYPAFSWSACSNTVDTDVDYSFTASSLISKAGTIGFHPLDDTLTAAKDAVVTLPIDGTDGFDVAYHFILRQNQGSTCTTDTETLATFTGWIFGDVHAIKDGQASIDFAKPVRDARMQPVGFDGSGAHAAELLQCDNHSILNESKSSRELTLYVLLAVLATIAVAAVVAMGWAIKTGHLSLDKFMSVVFSEPVCIVLDVVFNVGDVLTFALVVFITLPSNDHFHNLLPVCYIFLVIALLSSLLTVFQAASLLVRILVQKKGDAGAYVAARAKQVAKRASFRAMTEGRDVQREHIDEALHALRRSDVGHMDEVEHLERELTRLHGDMVTIFCEAIPVASIQFKIISSSSTFSFIPIVSLVLACSIAGSKLTSLTRYMDVRKKLIAARTALRENIKVQIDADPEKQIDADGIDARVSLPNGSLPFQFWGHSRPSMRGSIETPPAP